MTCVRLCAKQSCHLQLSLSHTHIHTPTLPGLLYIQNGDSLTDLTGFNNLLYVKTLVLALLGTGMTDLAGFSSLYNASRLYITRNSVSHVNFLCITARAYSTNIDYYNSC